MSFEKKSRNMSRTVSIEREDSEEKSLIGRESMINNLYKTDSNGCHQEGSVRELGVFFEIFRISNIDTEHSTFQVQFELQFTWLPSKEDLEAYDEEKVKKGGDYTPSFIPKYNWTNSADIELTMDSGYEILRNGGEDMWGNEVKLPVPFANAVS